MNFLNLSPSVSDLEWEREFECFAVAMEQVCVKCFIKNLRAPFLGAPKSFSLKEWHSILCIPLRSLWSLVPPEATLISFAAQVSFLRARRQSASLWWNFRFISHSRNDSAIHREWLERERRVPFHRDARGVSDSRHVIGRGDAQLFGVLADWPLLESGNRTRSIRFAHEPLSSINSLWCESFKNFGVWRALEEMNKKEMMQNLYSVFVEKKIFFELKFYNIKMRIWIFRRIRTA